MHVQIQVSSQDPTVDTQVLLWVCNFFYFFLIWKQEIWKDLPSVLVLLVLGEEQESTVGWSQIGSCRNCTPTVQFFLIFSNLEVGNMEGFTIGTSTTSTRRRIGKYSRLVTDRLLSKLHRRYVVQVCTGMQHVAAGWDRFFF